MRHQLSFEQLAVYDAGQAGISVLLALRSGSNAVRLEAKIDTGATDCVFARQQGEQLGLNVESGERVFISTATGRFAVYGYTVTLSVLGYDFDAYVFFAEDENFARNVLGRRGLLDRVRLGIVDYEGKLYLNCYDEE